LSKRIFNKRHNLNSLVSLVSHITKRKVKAFGAAFFLIILKSTAAYSLIDVNN